MAASGFLVRSDWGETLGLPGGTQVPAPGIWTFLPDLSSCSTPQAAFVPSCNTPPGAFGFDKAPFESLGDLWTSPLDTCKAKAAREWGRVDTEINTPRTSPQEGARRTAAHLAVEGAVEGAAHLFGWHPAVPLITSTALGLHAIWQEAGPWLRRTWENNRNYSAMLDLCEAAFGKP